MLTHQLEVEVNGIDTEVEVDYQMQFGQPEIMCIMDLSTRELVDIEEISDHADFKHQLTEWATNVGQVYLDYSINN